MAEQRDIKAIITAAVAANSMFRAVILNGSRANPNIIADQYQDYDIAIFVTDFEQVKASRFWLDLFGKPILAQYPDDMLLGAEDIPKVQVYTCLMIFADGIRIDLKIYPVKQFNTQYQRDSLTVVWLDKDQLFSGIAESNEQDYFIKIPEQRLFSEVANEFYWSATNIMKGLAREEIIYAKEMLETVVRPVFMTMLQWKVGAQFGFDRSLGKSGKRLSLYLSAEEMQEIMSTYVGSTLQENWQALLKMLDIFAQLQLFVAEKLHFTVNKNEIDQARKYITQTYIETSTRK